MRSLTTKIGLPIDKALKPEHSEPINGSKNKKTVFSLIQPTGIPHLGNYLGALRTWKDLQKKTTSRQPESHAYYDLYFGLADLHSLTLKQDPKARNENIRRTYASLLAIGIPHDILFVQSYVAAHTELMWILSNVASTGYLSRMTQWKDKAGLLQSGTQPDSQTLESLDDKSKEALKLGLFSYPVLQAADILLYDTHYVPVGEDQAQHVEFTRSLARSFNHMYGKDEQTGLRVPELMLSPAKRIMSLQDPIKKMSKSDPDSSSRILINDSAETIRSKIKSAKTDSVPGPITFDPQTRPGVSNLIEIYRHTTRSPKSPSEVAEEFANASLGDLKTTVSDAVIEALAGMSHRYDEFMGSKKLQVEDFMLRGYGRADKRANRILLRVREAVGLQAWTAGTFRKAHLMRKQAQTAKKAKESNGDAAGGSEKPARQIPFRRVKVDQRTDVIDQP